MDKAVAAETGTTLRLWHRFEAVPERVFAAWTRPEALKLWWCPDGWRPVQIDVDLRLGGVYRLSMNRERGTQMVTVHGRFLEIQPPRRLVYTWRWDGMFPDMRETIVTVEFRAVTGGTELALRQGVLELPMCGRHLSGWLVACGRLAEVVETRTMPIRHGASRDMENRPAT
jgi:uncharacterized protein YndB with AHSA1/START domain